MDATTVVLLAVCVALGVALEAYAVRARRAGGLPARSFWLLSAFACLMVVLGFSFRWHEHYLHFGFLHLTATLFFIALPFVLRVFVPDKDAFPRRHNTVVWAMTAVVLVFTLFKFSYVVTYGLPVYQVLPLNACNLAAVAIIVRPFLSNARLDNYLLCFGLLGFFMNLIMGVRYGLDQNFYTDVVYESNITHNIFVTYCVYMLLSGAIRPDVKRSLQNMFWLIPLFVVYVFTNQIYRFNFFYTGVYENPVVGLYHLFPTFDARLFGFTFEFNPLYYVVVLVATAVVLWLLVWGLSVIARRLDARATARASEGTPSGIG